jgi:hypothetical protein
MLGIALLGRTRDKAAALPGALDPLFVPEVLDVPPVSSPKLV